ncbi:MAG: hypothetical protein ACXVAY_04455 [Mucilaginibacter sp.]
MSKPIPYNFVFDYLPGHIVVKPIFGMHYIYLNKKIMLVLRKVGKNLDLNGVWVATSKEHHQSLQNDAPGLTDFVLDNGDKHDSDWRLIREDDDDFEAAVIRICELISHGDKRIGRITKGAAEL